MDPIVEHQLLAIVSVDHADRVQCGQPGCGHSVFRQIHVVKKGEKHLVLGSTCFAKRFGSAAALGTPRFGGGGGRPLTIEERRLLVENTALLITRFEAERARTPTPAPSEPLRFNRVCVVLGGYAARSATGIRRRQYFMPYLPRS